ncbi:hypothetical protein SAY87_015319 [Trapa incisa]|nr:hypothetical protein SAY87_015319 [Trapa incisa]
MALLRLSLSASSVGSDNLFYCSLAPLISSSSSIRPHSRSPSNNAGLSLSFHSGGRRRRRTGGCPAISCSNLDTEAVAADGQVTEVDKDSFWPIVKAAGDKIVVLDMYTQWCGPCKVMAPKVQELSKKYKDVIFLKLDCNQENKPLAKELGISVVPTFKIMKDGKIVQEIVGAKFDDLVAAIETARSS